MIVILSKLQSAAEKGTEIGSSVTIAPEITTEKFLQSLGCLCEADSTIH